MIATDHEPAPASIADSAIAPGRVYLVHAGNAPALGMPYRIEEPDLEQGPKTPVRQELLMLMRRAELLRHPPPRMALAFERAHDRSRPGWVDYASVVLVDAMMCPRADGDGLPDSLDGPCYHRLSRYEIAGARRFGRDPDGTIRAVLPAWAIRWARNPWEDALRRVIRRCPGHEGPYRPLEEIPTCFPRPTPNPSRSSTTCC